MHLYLSPNTILLDQEFAVKISDYGNFFFSCFLGLGYSHIDVRKFIPASKRRCCFEYSYIAPELLTDWDLGSQASDVFSFGEQPYFNHLFIPKQVPSFILFLWAITRGTNWKITNRYTHPPPATRHPPPATHHPPPASHQPVCVISFSCRSLNS
jgi:hypothetical protein